MKPFLVACAFILATLAAIPTADARRGNACKGGACGASANDAIVYRPHVAAGHEVKIGDKTYKPGQQIPTAPKAVQVPVVTADYKRQPIKAVGSKLYNGGKAALGKALPPYRRGCRGGRCG